MTEEHKEKIRKGNIGKKHSEEAKAKMREAKRPPWSEERKLRHAEAIRSSAYKRTGLKRTDEQKVRMSEGQRNRSPESRDCNRRPMSDEVKLKVSIGRKGKAVGQDNHFFGKKHSEESKVKISASLKVVHSYPEMKEKMRLSLLGKKMPPRSLEHRRRLSVANSGERGSNWQGGKVKINKILRKGIDFKNWRANVFGRDNWVCQKTGGRGGKLHPHHIFSFSDNDSIRFETWNGITLSELSHREFHKLYGKTNNTLYQLEDFLGRQLPFEERSQLIAYETANAINEVGDSSPSFHFIKV